MTLQLVVLLSLVLLTASPVSFAFTYQGSPLSCGSVTFDINTQTCCLDDNFNTYVVEQPGMLCCGSAGGYDFKTQVCQYMPPTGHFIRPKPAALSSLLCYASSITEGTSYDPSTSTCCVGKNNDFKAVVYPGVVACCGSLQYEPSTEVCCQNKYGQVSIGQGDNLACCGSTPYNPASSTCCKATTGDATLFTGGGLDARCCNGKMLDTTKQICCQDALAVEVTDPNTARCCGVKAYYPPKESCCLGSSGTPSVAVANLDSALSKGVDVYSPMACCVRESTKTTFAYDPLKQKCCGGYLKKLTDKC